MSRHRHRRLIAAGLAALAAPVLLPTGAAADPAAACGDLLVIHGPGGSTGDTEAVTITSQVLERGTEGWASVGWQVAEGTELRAVMVVSDAGVAQLPGTSTVADGPARELHFCGARTAITAATADPGSGDGAAAVTDRPGRTQTVVSRATTASAPAAAPLGILGAGLGAAVAGVVLLLSRSNRDERGVLR